MIFADYPGHFVAGLLLAAFAVLIVFAFRSSELLKAKLKRQRLLLMLLQYAAVMVLLLVAWNPSRSKEREIFSRNSVLALFDTSQSMSIAEDAQKNRLDKAITAFTERFCPSEQPRSAGTQPQGPQYRIFGFDRQAYYSGSVGLLRRWGSQTDLHSAFALLNKYSDRKADSAEAAAKAGTDANMVAGAVIFTDGQAADKNIETYPPLSPRLSAGVPRPVAGAKLSNGKDFQIVLVGVGSRQPQRDIAIRSITAPSRVAIDSAYNVQVAISARALKDEPVTIELLQDNRIIDSNQLYPHKLSPGKNRYSQSRFEPYETIVEFTVGANTLGSHTLSARAKPLEKEVNPANNQRSTVVEVTEEQKLKVLFYCQVANFNVGKIRQALARDDKIQLDLGLDAIKNPALSQDAMSACGGFGYTKLPDRREEIYKYDIIILGPCNAGSLTDAQVDGLYSFVVDRGGGLILLPARARSAGQIWTNDKIQSLMPVTIPDSSGLSQTDNSGHIELTFEGIDSKIISQTDPDLIGDALISAYCRITDTKPAASTLATVRDTPVICVHRVGRGRVCLINISQPFLLYRQDRDGGLLQKLMSGLTSYVGRVANVEAGVELFAQRVGEESDRVRFSAYVCDKSFAPVSGANVLLNVKGQALSMNQASPGYYAAEIENAGDQSIVATAQAEINGVFLGEKTIAVNLPPVQTEMADTEIDEEFLVALAKRLNGKYVHVEDLAKDSAQMFQAQVQIGSETRMTSAWPTWLLLLPLCLLLSISWYVRRAIGLV
jgi:hypothetical protein